MLSYALVLQSAVGEIYISQLKANSKQIYVSTLFSEQNCTTNNTHSSPGYKKEFSGILLL